MDIAHRTTATPPVAIVTGISSAIGAASAARLARLGYRVFGTARRPKDDHQVIEGERIETIALDVTDSASVDSAIDAILARTGRIDVLVNNAGVTIIGAAEEFTDEEARAVIETNFMGVHRMTRAVLPVMRRQKAGRIVTVGSVAGFLPKPFEAFYSATKHAIEGYLESLAHEVWSLGIHISIIEPGYVCTDFASNATRTKARLDVYDEPRALVMESLERCVAEGVRPAVVADKVMRAVTRRWPRLRYRAGFEARVFHLERTFVPQWLFARGVRIHFFGWMYRLRELAASLTASR